MISNGGRFAENWRCSKMKIEFGFIFTENERDGFGLRECLFKALRDPPPSAIFGLDSLLVVMMMSRLWGCHRKHLLTLQECYDLGEQLEAAGCSWFIRHIYREYNTVAERVPTRTRAVTAASAAALLLNPPGR